MPFRHALVLAAAVLPFAMAWAQTKPPQSEGERLFVEGTALFRASGSARDPHAGLRKLLAAAELRYEHAPYGLCIALSAEPEVVDLVESYAWCELAARAQGRFAPAAKNRATEVLGRIAVHGGAERVAEAKARAAELARKHGAA